MINEQTTKLKSCRKNFIVKRLILTLFSLFFIPAYAASPAFQNFLFNACRNAQIGSAFDTRCNVDSNKGDLSGDSEDSLNPTQSLSNMTNALEETRARIKVLQTKMKQQREKNKASMSESEDDKSAMNTFQMAGFSLIVNGENNNVDHQLTAFERGYSTDSYKFQGGVDYRISDDWIVGAILSYEKFDTVFDADTQGRNFQPGNSEGDSRGNTVSINLITTKNIDQSFYIDAMFSYSWNNYTFSRIGLFQESSRTIPTLNVNTSADSSGRQLALSFGAGWDHVVGAHNYQVYGRLIYQDSKINGYAENGGAGFGMRINDKRASETLLTVGLKYAYAITTDIGVIVPQIFMEYENFFNSDIQTTTSSFLFDSNQTQFNITGDKVDKQYGRIGASIVSVRPNGWTYFASISEIINKDLVKQSRLNAGLRVEF